MGGQQNETNTEAGTLLKRTPSPLAAIKAIHPLTVAISVFVVAATVALGRHSTYAYRNFEFGGFDLGIFSQGTWLLSQLETPFVTIRGLNLFGDHASYILALVAPLYRIWPDPQMLLWLQSIAVMVPALAVYRLGARHNVRWAGFAVAIAYVLYPGIQWAALNGFHPETLASAFLALALLSADRKGWRTMALWLGLAVLCKEDVALVVGAFGLFVFMHKSRRVGAIIAGASAYYFALIVFFVMPLTNGERNLYFERNYGVEHAAPWKLVGAAPQLLNQAFSNAIDEKGLLYLTLILLPMLLLPLLQPKWLLPALPPVLLNLASNVPYQREVKFQYLVTAAPFIGFAALAGLMFLRDVGKRTSIVMVTLVVTAAAISWDYGASGSMWERRHLRAAPQSAEYREVMELIPDDAGVSSYWIFASHLTDRKILYEFPNPYRPANWGLHDTPVSAEERRLVTHVLVDPKSISATEKAIFEALKNNGEWKLLADKPRIALLARR